MTAPDQLEPYTVRLRVESRATITSPADLVARLLEDIARRCEAAGCSVIGHIKCHADAPGRAFSCSLTSRRSGAVCRGAVEGPLPAGGALHLDLAVLVYGIPADETETAVKGALADSPAHAAGEWLTLGESSPHHHDC